MKPGWWLGSLGLLLCASTAQAEWFQDFDAMFGIDIRLAHIKTHDDFTKASAVLPENYWGNIIYGGPRFGNTAVLVGWDSINLTTKESKISENVRLGTASASGPSTLETKINLFGPALEIAQHWSVTKPVEVFLSIGLGFIKASIDFRTLSGPGLNDSFFGKTRMMPRIGVGGNWKFNQYWGLRLKANWDGTTNVRLQQKNTGIQYKLYKDSVSASLGVFGNF